MRRCDMSKAIRNNNVIKETASASFPARLRVEIKSLVPFVSVVVSLSDFSEQIIISYNRNAIFLHI